MERYAPRYDALAFTLVEMLAAFAGLLASRCALGQLSVPHGWTVWGALLVTGVFASALAFLAQTWAQRRASATQTALAFSLEPVWAAFFGFTLAGDRLGAVGWLGCAVIMAGIVVAEPAAAGVLARLVRRPHDRRASSRSRSAALFGAMTVAVRLGLREPRRRGRRRARDGHSRARASRSSRLRSPRCARAWPFLLAGLLAPGGSQILFTLAVREVGASRTSVAVGAAPLVAVAIALIFLDEPLRAPLMLGALAIVAGGVLLAAERDRPGHLRGAGAALRSRRGGALRDARQHRARACTRTRARTRPRPRRWSPARSSRRVDAARPDHAAS